MSNTATIFKWTNEQPIRNSSQISLKLHPVILEKKENMQSNTILNVLYLKNQVQDGHMKDTSEHRISEMGCLIAKP